jgi:hypothetical protein
MTSLAKYNIAYDEPETTDALRAKLAGFYAAGRCSRRPSRLPTSPKPRCS